jgi:hypothetical protein
MSSDEDARDGQWCSMHVIDAAHAVVRRNERVLALHGTCCIPINQAPCTQLFLSNLHKSTGHRTQASGILVTSGCLVP